MEIGFVHEERKMLEPTVSGKVCLAWKTDGGGVSNVVDGIRGSTKSALVRISRDTSTCMRDLPVITVGLNGCIW